MEHTERLLAVLAGTFVLGIAIQWFAWRIRMPAILLLLAGGFLAGPVTHAIDPKSLFGDLLLPVVSLSVGLILFEGGLNLRLMELKGTWRSLVGLLTIGVLVTWIGSSVAAWYLLGIPKTVALILGAVLVVTGPTVIGPLLRDIRPSGRVGAVAKWEGIVIDPVGATMALLVFEAIDSIRHAEFGSVTVNVLSGLATTALVGLLVGFTAAGLLVLALKRFWIPDYLQNPVTLMFVMASFAIANGMHHEAGLLAVTVLGVALANQRQVPIQKIVEFKESLTVMLISMLFVLLTARIPLEALTSVGWRGVAFALTLVLVVRPLSVWLSTIGSGLSRAERCFLSFFAPRGIVAAAVSSVFALRLGESGAVLAPATLVVIFVTVAVYGLTAGPLARRLGLAIANAQGVLIAGANQSARAIASVLAKEGFTVVLVDSRYPRIRKSRDAGLTACFANVMSEHVLDSVNFAGIGRFLALTSNDEVNALASVRFREMFGRENVFRLASVEARHTRYEPEWHHHFSGRTLFSPTLTYEWLDTALDDGATIKVTRLSEKFSFETFQSHYGERAWPLFVIDGKRLVIISTDSKLAPKAGQLLVSLVLPGTSDPQDPPPQPPQPPEGDSRTAVTSGHEKPSSGPAKPSPGHERPSGEGKR
jgi:NhaP-type Na+/H+ or K+/H+ antiporter